MKKVYFLTKNTTLIQLLQNYFSANPIDIDIDVELTITNTIEEKTAKDIDLCILHSLYSNKSIKDWEDITKFIPNEKIIPAGPLIDPEEGIVDKIKSFYGLMKWTRFS